MTIENFKLPVGRIVAGNPAIAQDKTNFTTGQKEIGADGQPVKEWRCDIAYPKDVFMKEIWPTMVKEAMSVYPNAQNISPDNYENDRFSFKVVNGDSPSCPKGSKIPYNTREGYKGCYIVKIRTSAFAPGIFKFENGAYRKIDASEIKTGDYVVANVNISVHQNNDGGLYWNPNGFELVGYGQEIKGNGGGNPDAMFGRQTYQLPAGASATPMSSAPSGTSMPLPTANSPSTPAVGQPAAQAMPQPAYDFVNNAGTQGMPQAPMGFTQPVANVAGQQPSAPQTANGTVPFATTLVTNR